MYDLDFVQTCAYHPMEAWHKDSDAMMYSKAGIEQSCLYCRRRNVVMRLSGASQRPTASMLLLPRLAWHPRTAWSSRMLRQACKPPLQLA